MNICLVAIASKIELNIHQYKHILRRNIPKSKNNKMSYTRFIFGMMVSWIGFMNMYAARTYMETNQHYDLPLDIILLFFSGAIFFTIGSLHSLWAACCYKPKFRDKQIQKTEIRNDLKTTTAGL